MYKSHCLLIPSMFYSTIYIYIYIIVCMHCQRALSILLLLLHNIIVVTVTHHFTQQSYNLCYIKPRELQCMCTNWLVHCPGWALQFGVGHCFLRSSSVQSSSWGQCVSYQWRPSGGVPAASSLLEEWLHAARGLGEGRGRAEGWRIILWSTVIMDYILFHQYIQNIHVLQYWSIYILCIYVHQWRLTFFKCPIPSPHQ